MKTYTETKTIESQIESAITWQLFEDGAGNLSLAIYEEDRKMRNALPSSPRFSLLTYKAVLKTLKWWACGKG